MPPRPSPLLPPRPPLAFYNQYPKAGAVCDALRAPSPSAALARIAQRDPMVFWSFFYTIFDDGELDLAWWPVFAAAIPWHTEIPRAVIDTSLMGGLLPPEQTTGTIGWLLQFANIVPSRYRLQALITSPHIFDQQLAIAIVFPTTRAAAQQGLAHGGPDLFSGLPDDPAIHALWRDATAVEEASDAALAEIAHPDTWRAAIGSLLLPAADQAFAWLQPGSVVAQLREDRAAACTRRPHETPSLTHSLARWALTWYPDRVSRHHRPVLRELLLHPDASIRVEAMRALGHEVPTGDPATPDRPRPPRR